MVWFELWIRKIKVIDFDLNNETHKQYYFIHRLVNGLLDRTMTTLDYIPKSSIPNLSASQAIITGVSFDLPVVVKIDQLQKNKAPNSSNSELLEMWDVISEEE